jgi:hypothetical protein
MVISGGAATHSAVPGPSTGSPPASSADPKGCVRYFISSQEVIPGFLYPKKKNEAGANHGFFSG